MYKVGIVGHGHVGGIMKQLFTDATVYDEPKGIGTRDEINNCDIVFVCVPTPKADDGHCDTTIVESVLDWIDSKCTIVLRSTVPVGFTDKAQTRYQKHIIFQPEYYGETTAHPFADPHNRNWITLGGELEHTRKVAMLYMEMFTSQLIINQVSAKTAELAKYMENTFYATKVTFCNQFYDLAEKLGVDYNQLRETWLLDPRISRSHTFVYPNNRGYGGSCLPKDTAATIYQANKVGVDMSILTTIESYNKEIHEKMEEGTKNGKPNNTRFWESP